MATAPANPDRAAAPRRRSRARWRRTVLVLSLVALVGWGAFRGLPLLFRMLAARELAARSVDSATRWLELCDLLGGGNAESELLWARVARRRQDYQAVGGHLQRAFDLGCPREKLELEQWLALAQAGQMREAEPHLSALLSAPGDDGAEICEAYVNGYLLTYDLSRAHLLLRGWEKDYPRDPLPHVIRGGLQQSSLAWAEAEKSFRKALALAPNDAEAVTGLADVLARQGNFEDAAGWYRQNLKRRPGDWQSRLGLARCLEAMGQPDEARHLLDALVAERPDDPQVSIALAKLELEARNDRRARELLERVRKADPHNPEMLRALAAVLRRAGETSEADTLAAELKASAEAKTRAERLLEKVAAEPADVDLRYELGILRLEYGPEREGVLWLKSVLERQPDHKPARAALEKYWQAKRKTGP